MQVFRVENIQAHHHPHAQHMQLFNNGGLVNEILLVTTMTITGKEHQFGSHQARDPTKYETPLSATYGRQGLNGNEGVLLDYMTNIFRIGGVDRLGGHNRSLEIS
ncbi:phage major tail tube protein [Pseudomonas fluorescens]|uniref:phage major tail tube protein n=1 Tax=Pseudomonas fluorescens TaxID=294 RepID=UPI00296607D4|nr:phage major tail tube protein [Pseudomonas fluorescens]